DASLKEVNAAASLADGLSAKDANDKRAKLDRAIAHASVGRTLARLGRHDEAIPVLQESIVWSDEIRKAEPSNMMAGETSASNCEILAAEQVSADQFDAAAETWRKAVATWNELCSRGAKHQVDRARSTAELGFLLLRSGKIGEGRNSLMAARK